jgi:hypothetical protein
VRRIPALLLCVLALFGGCGRKTPVKPPELAAPETIDGLDAANQSSGIRLGWPRPRTYADGSTMFNLAGFRLERAQNGTDFALIAELPVTDRDRFRQIRRFRYLDRDVVENVEYRYRLFSFTLDRYVSAPSNVAQIVRVAPTPAATPSPAGEEPRP